jgi:2-dehydro-3-deoxygluconokinase
LNSFTAARALLGGRRFHLVGLGEAMLEFNQTRADAAEYLQGFGGDTSNAVIAAARAGATVAYLTRVGQDSFGRALVRLWHAEGVCTEGVEKVESSANAGGSTGIYFVSHGPSGHEFTYKRADSPAASMQPEHLWVQGIEQSQFLHVSAISQAISLSATKTVAAALKIARAAKTLVSYDTNLRLRLWSLEHAREVMVPTIGLSDVFLPSLEDMQTLTGLHRPNEILRWSHEQGASLVFLKLGAQGVLVSDGNSSTHLDGLRSDCLDATGAGDCFAGNLIARLAQGDTALEAARYANAAAALSVQGFGAVAPLPRKKEVQDFLFSFGA